MKTFITFIFFIGLYLVFVIRTIDAPVTYDELYWPIAAQSLVECGRPFSFYNELADWSPSLYVNTQALLYRIFGVSNYSSRLIGISCMLLQFVIIFLILKVLFKDTQEQRKNFFLFYLLFFISPAVIQGSLITFNDTTFLPLAFTTFTLFFIKFENRKNIRNVFILTIVFAVALWSRLTTPFVFIMSMILYYLLKKETKGMLSSVCVFIAGLVIFLVTWKIYCIIADMDFFGPFRYTAGSFQERQLFKIYTAQVTVLLASAIRVALWAGVYFLLLWFLVCVKRFHDFRQKNFLEPVDFSIFFTILAGIGYFLIGGIQFGFPKYQYPVLAAMSITITVVLKDIFKKLSRKDFVLILPIIILLVLFYYFIVQDLLYIFNFSLREAMAVALDKVKSICILFAFKLILYLLPSILTFIVISRYKKTFSFFERIAVSLLIMVVATNISLNLRQYHAGYLIRYCYGEKGTKELIRNLNEQVKLGDKVLAPNDIIYYLRDKKISYLPLSFWNRLDVVMAAVEEPDVKFVVYSIGHNTIEQFERVFSREEFISKMNNNFIKYQIGSYAVWKRKS